jgi:hypothetical protein
MPGMSDQLIVATEARSRMEANLLAKPVYRTTALASGRAGCQGLMCSGLAGGGPRDRASRRHCLWALRSTLLIAVRYATGKLRLNRGRNRWRNGTEIRLSAGRSGRI